MLAAVGLSAGMVTDYVYQTTVATIALSLVSSPVWIAIVKRLARPADGLGGAPPADHSPDPAPSQPGAAAPGT